MKRGREGGQKSPKLCLRNIWMVPETFCHLFFFIRNKSHIGNDLELYWKKNWVLLVTKIVSFFRWFLHNWANFYKSASWEFSHGLVYIWWSLWFSLAFEGYLIWECNIRSWYIKNYKRLTVYSLNNSVEFERSSVEIFENITLSTKARLNHSDLKIHH